MEEKKKQPINIFSLANVPFWECSGGFLTRFWKTTWQILLHPKRTLRPISQYGINWPLSYGLILGTIGISSQIFWNYYLGFSDLSLAANLVLLFFVPLQVIFFLFFFTIVIHSLFFIFNVPNQGCRATLRALGYTQAVSLWLLLPVIGCPLAISWGLITFSNTLSAVHKINKGQIFIILMLPVFFTLLVLFVLGVLFYVSFFYCLF